MSNFDFIAVDFETANSFNRSACSIGIAAVKDFEIADTYYSLINPNMYFDEKNISIHGIKAKDVENAPIFNDIWPCINKYFGISPILAHNAYFDMSVLKSLLINQSDLDFKYVDTISICKHFVPGKKNLSACANFFNIDIENHHNSLDDAVACAKIAINCLKLSGYKTLQELCFYISDISVHSFSELEAREKAIFKENISKSKHFAPKISKIKPSDITQTVSSIDESNPLYGKNIVFTGELEMSRLEAMQIAVNNGAIVKTSVSKKVHYLVIGKQDKSLVGYDGLSTKEKKAIEINSIGDVHIDMITEKQFLSLANGEVVV